MLKHAVRGPRTLWRDWLSLLGLCILVVALGACHKSVGKGAVSSRTQGGTDQVLITFDQSSGKTFATLAANSTVTQVVKVPATSPVAGTSLAIPPGTLGVSTDVTIELAAPLVNPGNSAALGLDSGSTVVGKAVSIQPTQPIDALKPFAVSLAVPSAPGLNLDDINTNLYVMYKVQNVQAGTVTLGIIPRSALTVNDGSVSFTHSFFGAFQPAISMAPITAAVQVPVVSAPILTQLAAAALPPLAVTARAPFIVKAGSTVTIAGRNFRPTMTLALGGKPVTNLKVASDTAASFTAPTYQGFGLSNLTADQDGSSTQSAVVYYTGTYADYPVSSKAVSEVCAGEKFYDSTGALQTGTRNCTILTACAADGATGCASNASFPAAQVAGLASKLLSSSTVAGVAGNVTNCAADGGTGCIAVASYPAAKLANFSASNIQGGITIAGITGSGFTTGTCTSDSQQNCAVTGVFKAANVTGMSPWDLRAGQALGGITGSLKTNCRNTVNSTYFNYDGAVASLPTTGVTTGTSLDYWDTVDDYYGYSATKVTAWSTNTNCDGTTWSDVTTTNGGTSNVACGTSSTCIYKDRITNLQVTGILASGNNTTSTTTPATYTWSAAVNACTSSTYGGYAAGTWRLPTQKELMSLYEHGIVSLVGTSFMSLVNMQNYFWSSSTLSGTTTSAWYVTLAYGYTSTTTKTTTDYVSCVQ